MCMDPLFSIVLWRSQVTFLCCFWNETIGKKNKHGCRKSPWKRLTTLLISRCSTAVLVGSVPLALFLFSKHHFHLPKIVAAGTWDCWQNTRLSVILQECKHLYQCSEWCQCFSLETHVIKANLDNKKEKNPLKIKLCSLNIRTVGLSRLSGRS